MRYYVTLNTLLGISRVTLHITTRTSGQLNTDDIRDEVVDEGISAESLTDFGS